MTFSWSRALRRTVCATVCAAFLGAGLGACGTDADRGGASDLRKTSKAQGMRFTDIVGRDVSLKEKPKRVILGEGRSVFATGILDRKHPLRNVVALGSDLKENVPDYMAEFEKVNPEVKNLPELGEFMKGDVTVENLIALKPDLTLLSLDEYEAGRKTGLTERMEQAKLTFAVTDFRAKPLENTTKSMDIFGAVFGREKEAKAFNADWRRTVELVKKRSEKIDPGKRPGVFVWRAAGLSDCCQSWNNSNISQLVNTAGGKNLGDSVIGGESGAVTPEKVIAENPKHIIATGGEWSAKRNKEGNPVGYAALGYRISPAQARDTVNRLPGVQPGFAALDAVRNGNLHGLWHQFYNSPFNYLALLQIASWLHPDLYADLNAEQEWLKAQKKYSPVSGEGVFFSTNNPTQEK